VIGNHVLAKVRVDIVDGSVMLDLENVDMKRPNVVPLFTGPKSIGDLVIAPVIGEQDLLVGALDVHHQ